MKDIAIYGAGGYGLEVACLIKIINNKRQEWNLIGFFDDGKAIGSQTPYGSILGGMDELNQWNNELSVVLAIGDSDMLKSVSAKIKNQSINFPNLIAPDVTFHDIETVTFGIGNIVFFHSILSCYTSFGNFNLLNNDVFVGHNTKIGSCNVLNPSTRISGDVTIGDNNFFGVCSIVLQGLAIGECTKISAGSCIFRNTKDYNLYTGNPAVIRLTPGTQRK